MDEFLIYAVLAVNVVTFAAFGLDKRRARKNASRISEARLIAFAWATGLFGAWLAMSLFRHKTQKRSFQVKMVLVSVANLLWLGLWWRLRG